MDPESDLVPFSALQHYWFCPQRRALTRTEQAWEETAWHGGDCECLTETSRPELFRPMADTGI